MAKEEIGRTGLRYYSGRIAEEFLPELKGQRGMKLYREMSENDDVVGAILYAIEMLIRQATWHVQPGGSSQKDEEAAEFVESCMNDMQTTWTDTLSEMLSFLIYGWSAHEIVYKRRMGMNDDPRLSSKYDDGLIGWRKLPIRSQDSLYQWEFDEEDNLVAMTQMPAPSYRMITIPMSKLLLFRTRSRKDSPEGQSILRNAYRAYHFKKRIQEIEGIGIERDLAGFPVLTAPEGVDIWDTNDPAMVACKAAADELVKNIRRDAMEGLTLPRGWELSLLSTGSRRQFDTNQIIERYDARIAMTVLADFVLLGHQQVGSFALSSDKTKMFSVAICSFLDVIAEVFNNKAIPKLIQANAGSFAGVTQMPQLEHGDVETQDIEKLGRYVSELTGAGVLLPDENLERYLREQAGIPERVDEYPMPSEPHTHSEEQMQDAMDAASKGAVRTAKSRLGR